MATDVPKYLPRDFKTQPADGHGVAIIDDFSAPNPKYPMLLFKAGNDPEGATSRAIQIAIRTNEEISKDLKTADLTADLKVGVFHRPYVDILKFGAVKFLHDKKLFDQKNTIGPVAQCTASFEDLYDCVPPFDYSPPCKNPQPYFDLVDDKRNPIGLDGAWFVLVGSIRSQGAALPPGTTISGQIALLFETES